MNDFNPQEYWEVRLEKEFGVLGVGHSGLSRQYNHWLYRVRARVFSRQAKSLDLDLSTANVLDVGSGTGFYIERWRQLGVLSVTGSDITTVAVQELKKRFPDSEFVQMDIGDPSAASHQYRYDIISAFDVLFHIVDDDRLERAIQNIYTLLNSGGLFIFSDNFLHGPPERVSYQVSRSLDDITHMLGRIGFHIIKRVPMFVLMSNPIDSHNWLFKLPWRITKYFIARSEVVGFAVGAALYPLELVLTSLLEESPTTEIMICRKPLPE